MKNLFGDQHFPWDNLTVFLSDVAQDFDSKKKWHQLIYLILAKVISKNAMYRYYFIVTNSIKDNNCHTFLCTFSSTDSICNQTIWTDSTVSVVRLHGIAITIILWHCSLSMSLLISLWTLCGPENYIHKNYCSRVV